MTAPKSTGPFKWSAYAWSSSVFVYTSRMSANTMTRSSKLQNNYYFQIQKNSTLVEDPNFKQTCAFVPLRTTATQLEHDWPRFILADGLEPGILSSLYFRTNGVCKHLSVYCYPQNRTIGQSMRHFPCTVVSVAKFNRISLDYILRSGLPYTIKVSRHPVCRSRSCLGRFISR